MVFFFNGMVCRALILENVKGSCFFACTDVCDSVGEFCSDVVDDLIGFKWSDFDKLHPHDFTYFSSATYAP